MAVLHTVLVKAVNPGGRVFNMVHEDDKMKNGYVGFLGDYVEGQHTIKKFLKPTSELVAKKEFPVFVMHPEMMADTSRLSLQRLELFEIEAGTPFVGIPTEEYDKLQVTADLLTEKSANSGVPVVGDKFVVADGKYTLKHTASVTDGDVYFEVVAIKDAHSRNARIGGSVFAKGNYKLYTIEARKERA